MTTADIHSFTKKQYGFGYEVMKEICVCEKCEKTASVKKLLCPRCGAVLPRKNLFDLYRRCHRSCKMCGTVLSDAMRYCPKCGEHNE